MEVQDMARSLYSSMSSMLMRAVCSTELAKMSHVVAT
jgi:hypothetical protein